MSRPTLTTENAGFKRLREFLADNAATSMWQRATHNGSIECFLVGRTIVLVQVFGPTTHPGGWDVFVPVSSSPNVDETLTALQARVREDML